MTIADEKTADQMIREWMHAEGVTLEYTFVPFSKSRNAKEKHPSLNWKVTIRKRWRADQPGDKAQDAFRVVLADSNYMAGSGHCPADKGKYNDGMGNGPRGASRDKRAAIVMECETGFAVRWSSLLDCPQFISPRKPILPDDCSVLACFAVDAGVLDASGFESWASDYGYDTDSRAAEKTYQACLETALKLRSGLGNDALERLCTACEGY